MVSEEKTPFFEPTFNRSVKPRARDQRLSSDGGVLLLREADERLGLVDRVHFHGAVPNAELPDILSAATVYLSGSLGSSALDKSMLEAMACELPMITGNPKFAEMFGPYADVLYCGDADPGALADALERVLTMSAEERARIGAHLRNQVVRGHNVEGLMDQVVAIMASAKGKPA